MHYIVFISPVTITVTQRAESSRHADKLAALDDKLFSID